jgi:hypothetical protein
VASSPHQETRRGDQIACSTRKIREFSTSGMSEIIVVQSVSDSHPHFETALYLPIAEVEHPCVAVILIT